MNDYDEYDDHDDDNDDGNYDNFDDDVDDDNEGMTMAILELRSRGHTVRSNYLPSAFKLDQI